MNSDDVQHLANLARIKLSAEEVAQFTTEIDAIVNYVNQLDDLVAADDLTKQPGAVYNVFREDEVTNDPGEFTEAILAEAPERSGQHLKVKKILDQNG